MTAEHEPPEGSDPARRILAMPKFGDGLGLHRMAYVLEALGNAWLDSLDAVKVTGTNGKGSVSAMIAAILSRAGVAVGLYTSPHLERFEERISVAGRPIDAEDFERSLDWFDGLRAGWEGRRADDRFGAFEALTAMALHHFSERRVDTAVAEAGIGGRYDATRVIPGETAALASIDLGHTGLLGGTEEEIAFDKADLCPPGGVLVVGPLHRRLAERLDAYCRLRGVATVTPARGVSNVSVGPGGTVFDLRVADLEIAGLEVGPVGAHQAHNAAVAVVAARRWLAAHRPGVDRGAFVEFVRSALVDLRLPGRLERIAADPEIVIDVGHTPRAAEAVAGTVPALFGGAPVLLVTGVSRDQDVAGILSRLLPAAARVVCTRARHRGASVDRIEGAAALLAPDLPRHAAATVEEALDLAADLARRHGLRVLVAGGLFLAAEAAAVARRRDPASLTFL